VDLPVPAQAAVLAAVLAGEDLDRDGNVLKLRAPSTSILQAYATSVYASIAPLTLSCNWRALQEQYWAIASKRSAGVSKLAYNPKC
jgi:hypothetical protein